MAEETTRCRAETKSGRRCKNSAGTDGFCYIESHGSHISHSRARYEPERVAELILDCDGNLSEVARQLSCSRRTVHNYVNEHDICAEARDEAREGFVDLAEQSLRKLVQSGNFKAVRFALRCWGRERGWSEKVDLEVSGKDGGPIQTEQQTQHTFDTETHLEIAKILHDVGALNTEPGKAPAGADDPEDE
jgi:hypothetical protein